MDAGHRETEKVLAELEKRIAKEYAKAEKEIQAKLDDYLKRFETKDKIKAQAVKDGKITKEEYEKWRIGQIMISKRWEEMRDAVAKDFANAAQIAKSVTNGYMPEVYAINHNYGTFQVEKTAHIDTSYTLYDRETVERLYNDGVIHWHPPGKKISEKIAMGEQIAWDKKQVQSVMTQAILQGESIGNIATRLSKAVGDSDRKAAIRNARTMTTGVENAGRVDSYERAEEMGIELEQEWLATIDDRTRHEHRLLDGQRVKVGEKFEVDGEEIAYPGDPEAAGYMIYNCRCTLIPALKDHPADHSMRANKSVYSEYEEWKNSRYEYHDPITKQDDIADMMRRSYIQDYKYLAGDNPNEPINPEKDILENTKPIEEPIKEPEGYRYNNKVVNGTDKSLTFERRKTDFPFEIDDVINAQGFDGLPKIVSKEEFEKAVKRANGGNGFVAQRTYSADDEETLESYRDQLYNGKWYVDCSTGGSAHGKGMYCASNFNGEISPEIEQEMRDYIHQNTQYTKSGAPHVIETFTLDPSARLLELPEGADAYDYVSGVFVDHMIREEGENNGKEALAQYLIDQNNLLRLAYDQYMSGKIPSEKLWETNGTVIANKKEAINKDPDFAKIIDDIYVRSAKINDAGSMAAIMGYDGIRTHYGTCKADVIVLNRTKVIFLKESEND